MHVLKELNETNLGLADLMLLMKSLHGAGAINIVMHIDSIGAEGSKQAKTEKYVQARSTIRVA